MVTDSDRFREAFDSLSPETRRKVADKLANKLRGQIAQKPQNRMFSEGTLWNDNEKWKKNGPWKNETGEELQRSLSRLSASNYSRIYHHLVKNEAGQQLKAEEQKFFDKFLNQPFFATHFTRNNLDDGTGNGTVKLYSRKKLMEEHPTIDFDQENSSDADLSNAANDEYAFFALECGHSPQKKSSFFGNNLYRFDFGQGSFQHAWISLNDMVEPRPNKLRNRIPGLAEHDYRMANALIEPTSKPYYVFEGEKMLPGVALTLIQASRAMSPVARDKILKAETSTEFNNVMNGLFRPEIKVARSLVSSNYEFHPDVK